MPSKTKKDPSVQNLLQKSIRLSNKGKDEEAEKVNVEIRRLRSSEAPDCFGHDDCSSFMLARCPWQMDCG